MNRLSVKQLHIHVTQGLQRQGAFKKDKQYNQAIDIALNKAVSRIIKDRLIPDQNIPHKFEINQKYVTDIQNLIVLEKELNLVKDTDRSYGVLPYDFSYLLGDNSYTVESCVENYSTQTETKTERVISIPFNTAKVATPYYNTISVAVGATVKSLATSGYVTKEEKVYLVDNVIDLFKQAGQVDVYWETYKGMYRPECFLLVTRTLTLTANITVDGTQPVVETIDSSITVFKSPLFTGAKVVNRDIKADFLFSAISSYYHKPIPTSPVALLSGNSLIAYSSERFLVNRILINYIRKPKLISLSLNQGSELAPSLDEEIGDLAVQILKKQIEDQSYVAEVQDNKGRVE